MLKVIGKYIADSGIDRLFIESGIYGSTTLGQIMEGEHMQRAIEAHSTMPTGLQNQGLFLRHYMSIFESLLLTIVTTRFMETASRIIKQFYKIFLCI